MSARVPLCRPILLAFTAFTVSATFFPNTSVGVLFSLKTNGCMHLCDRKFDSNNAAFCSSPSLSVKKVDVNVATLRIICRAHICNIRNVHAMPIISSKATHTVPFHVALFVGGLEQPPAVSVRATLLLNSAILFSKLSVLAGLPHFVRVLGGDGDCCRVLFRVFRIGFGFSPPPC